MTALTDKEITNLDSHVEYFYTANCSTFTVLIDFEVHICFADNSMRLVSYHQSRWWGLQALIYCNCYNTMQIKLRWALFVTYTIIQSIMSSEMCSLHLCAIQVHTLSAVGSRHCSWGFGALLKGLTSVDTSSQSRDTSCQSRDLNPQPWVTSGFKYNALSIRPRLPHLFMFVF